MLTPSIRNWAVAVLFRFHYIPLGADAAASCYRINGDEADNTFVPCSPDAEVSACCSSNKENGDICLSSGLCYAQADPFQGLIFSRGCTDRTGKSLGCPQICPGSKNDSNRGGPIESWNIFQCNATAVCCRTIGDNGNCCNNHDRVVNNFTPGTLLLASLTATVTASSSNPPTNISNDSCPTDHAAVVGGAVGGALGAALLGALGTIAVLMKKRNNLTEPAAAENVPQSQSKWDGQECASPSQHMHHSKFTSPQPSASTPRPHSSTPPTQEPLEIGEQIERHEL